MSEPAYGWPGRSLWIVATICWSLAVVAAFVFRDTLATGWAGGILLLVLCAPIAWLLLGLFVAVSEGLLALLLLLAFKVVTLGLIRTQFYGDAVAIPWYGLGHAEDGALVASQGIVAVIGVAVYLTVGALGYYFVGMAG